MLAGERGGDSPTDGVSGADGAETGFTLVEVLAVVLILGVLSFIALSSLSPGQGKTDRRIIDTGDRQACLASASTIQTAALAYFVDHEGAWPVDIAALAGSTPAYIRSLPKARWNLVYDNTSGQVNAAGCDNLVR